VRQLFLARDLGVRGSLDVDVYRAVAQNVAEADLRRAAEIDLGDWFLFTVGAAAPIGNNSLGSQSSQLGTTTWVIFTLDLSGHRSPFDGAVSRCAAIARGLYLLSNKGDTALPTGGHVADKVPPTYERQRRIGDHHSLPDLVDLVAIAGRVNRAQSQATPFVQNLNEGIRAT